MCLCSRLAAPLRVCIRVILTPNSSSGCVSLKLFLFLLLLWFLSILSFPPPPASSDLLLCRHNFNFLCVCVCVSSWVRTQDPQSYWNPEQPQLAGQVSQPQGVHVGHHSHAGTPCKASKCAGIVLAHVSNPSLAFPSSQSHYSVCGVIYWRKASGWSLCSVFHLRNSNVNGRECARLSNQANSERVLMR